MQRWATPLYAGIVAWPLLSPAPCAQTEATGSGPLFPLTANTAPHFMSAPDPDLLADVAPSHRLIDLDGDGHLDALSLHRGCTTWRGAGDGTFGEPITSPGGFELRGGVLADMNGDGLLDALFPDLGSQGHPSAPGAVIVLISTTDGTFGAPVITNLAGSASALAAADLDLDGVCDVAVIVNQGQEFRLHSMKGLGTGALAPPGPGCDLGGDSKAIRIGDLDRDGAPDVAIGHDDVLSNYCGGSFPGDRITRWRILGDGSFEEFVPYLCTLTSLAGLELVDVDGDGWLDLLVSHAADTGWFRNLGGTFANEVLIQGTIGPSLRFETAGGLFDHVGGASVFEGDGLADLLTSNANEHRLLPGLGGGAFGGPVAQGEFGARILGLGDVDEDGRLDLAANDSGVNVLLRGLGDGGFEGPRLLLADSPYVVTHTSLRTTADFNADGAPDFAARIFSGGWKVVLMLSQEFAVYGATPVFSAGSIESVEHGDFDGDGNVDLLLEAPTAALTILPGVGDGTFGSAVVQPGALPELLAAGDVDGDGLTDILSRTGDAATVLLAQGGFAFSAPLPVTHLEGNVEAELSDLDGDGLDDIVLAMQSGPKLITMLATGAGTFAGQTFLPFGGEADSLAFGDVDGDGSRDILVTDDDEYGSGSVAILLGSGTGSFAAAEPLSTPGRVVQVDVADVDRDGRPDVLAAASSLTEPSTAPVLLIFRGLGEGEFSRALTYGTGTVAAMLAVGDANADGWPDIYAAGYGRIVLSQHQWGPWRNRGHALAGVAGQPHFEGQGALLPGSAVAFELTSAAPSASCTLMLGLDEALLPFKGGVLVPAVDVLLPGLSTDPDGRLRLESTWPEGILSGTALLAQFWISDAAAPAGVSASNGVRMTVP
jgi:hypothetical protein